MKDIAVIGGVHDRVQVKDKLHLKLKSKQYKRPSNIKPKPKHHKRPSNIKPINRCIIGLLFKDDKVALICKEKPTTFSDILAHESIEIPAGESPDLIAYGKLFEELGRHYAWRRFCRIYKDGQAIHVFKSYEDMLHEDILIPSLNGLQPGVVLSAEKALEDTASKGGKLKKRVPEELTPEEPDHEEPDHEELVSEKPVPKKALVWYDTNSLPNDMASDLKWLILMAMHSKNIRAKILCDGPYNDPKLK